MTDDRLPLWVRGTFCRDLEVRIRFQRNFVCGVGPRASLRGKGPQLIKRYDDRFPDPQLVLADCVDDHNRIRKLRRQNDAATAVYGTNYEFAHSATSLLNTTCASES